MLYTPETISETKISWSNFGERREGLQVSPDSFWESSMLKSKATIAA
jgi:hypothetical protein